MKRRVIVPSADRQIDEIADFILAGNAAASNRYTQAVRRAFIDLPVNVVPARASPRLPKDVRQMEVPGFPGYTIRMLFRGDHVALVAAFRPGLSAAMRDRATQGGLAEFDESLGGD